MKTENENRKQEAPDEAERLKRLREEDRAKYPRLHRYALFSEDEEWTEQHEIWLEVMMGEK